LSIISTHRGIGTVFNEIITEIVERGNRMGWSLHTIPIQKAVEQGLVERINAADQHDAGSTEGGLRPTSADAGEILRTREQWLGRQRAECIDEEQWLQEYCCVPANEAAAFISYDLINACTEPECLVPVEQLAKCSHPLFLGVDVARKKDLCVLDVGERIGDVVWDRLRIELLNRPFGQIEEELYGLLRLRQVKRACIDATGLGAQLAERAAERFGYKVEPILFTTRVKEELAVRFKVELEKRQVRLSDEEALRADLRAIRKEVTLSGQTRYAGESEGSHCDRFWAKALRQYAAREKICTGPLVA
jgi:phage FluMu gp28-like protein